LAEHQQKSEIKSLLYNFCIRCFCEGLIADLIRVFDVKEPVASDIPCEAKVFLFCEEVRADLVASLPWRNSCSIAHSLL